MPPQAKPIFILMIEDDCDHAQTVGDLLKLEGYAVECEQGGVPGLARAAEAMPDLVLLDFTLPDVSGADVGKALRANASTVSIPIVIGSGMPEWVVRESFSDFDAFLAKPLDPDRLLAVIGKLTGDLPLETGSSQC